MGKLVTGIDVQIEHAGASTGLHTIPAERAAALGFSSHLLVIVSSEKLKLDSLSKVVGHRPVSAIFRNPYSVSLTRPTDERAAGAVTVAVALARKCFVR